MLRNWDAGQTRRCLSQLVAVCCYGDYSTWWLFKTHKNCVSVPRCPISEKNAAFWTVPRLCPFALVRAVVQWHGQGKGCQFVHHEFYMKWLGSNLGLRSERRAAALRVGRHLCSFTFVLPWQQPGPWRHFLCMLCVLLEASLQICWQGFCAVLTWNERTMRWSSGQGHWRNLQESRYLVRLRLIRGSYWMWRFMSSGTWCRIVWYISANVS